MEKDLNNEQSVASQDLNNADAVNQQDLQNDLVNQTQSDGTLADGSDADKKTVKYSEFQKANDAKKVAEEAQITAEEQTATAQRQLELLQMQKLADANPVQPKTSAEQALANLGLTADQLYGEDIVRFTAEKDRIDAVNQQNQQVIAGVQQFVVNHSDINEVVGSVNPATGQIVSPNAEVLALLVKKPYLRQSTTEAIYNAVLDARRLAEFEKTAGVNKEHENRQNADNASAPMGGSAAGGGGSEQNHKTTLLSREQVKAEETKIAAGEYD